MRRSLFPSACLAAGALACLAASAPAADLDRYLPDDAQMVAVVNVKQITSWTPFEKVFRDDIQKALQMGPPAEILKDTGFDPLRDVDRVVIVAAASSAQVIKPPKSVAPPPPIKPPPGAAVPPPPPPVGIVQSQISSPIGFTTFALIQGKFDADKLEAKAKQAAKDHPDMVKSRKVGDAQLWEFVPPGPGDQPHIYVAMLEKDVVMASLLEAQALDALDKAAGKKQTDLKDKQVRDALAKLDPKAAVQAAASGDLVLTVGWKSDGKGGFTPETYALHDAGFEGFRGAITLGDADLHYEFTLTAKDADKAKETAKTVSDGVDKSIKDAKEHPERIPKEMLPAIDALKAVKIAASGDTVSVEGSATAEQVEAAVKGFFLAMPGPATPPPPPTVRPPDKPVPPPDLPKKDK